MTHSFGLDDGFLIAAFVSWLFLITLWLDLVHADQVRQVGFLAESLTLMVVGHIELHQGIIGPALLLGKVGLTCAISIP